MVKQISLDAWQIQHLTDLLKKGSEIVGKTNKPIVLYRQTFTFLAEFGWHSSSKQSHRQHVKFNLLL